MKAEQHPEFQPEDTHLADTLTKLWDEIDKQERIKSTGVHSGAAQKVDEVRKWLMAKLKSVERYPYHGRLDLTVDGKPHHFYIGREQITTQFEKQEFLVISWDSPIGRLFSQGPAKDVRWTGGSGQPYKGQLLLKRRFSVGELSLLEIDDEIDRRDGRERTTTIGDDYIVRKLYQRGDQRLQDIVETIQQEQASIIFSPSQRVLILNGVAGSGKTSIALHRLAWLLGNDADTRVDPRRAIVFAPNRLFVGYIDQLISDLGRGSIPHTTFNDWALRRLRPAFKASSRGERGWRLQEIHPDELSKSDRRKFDPAVLERRSGLRGSLRMRELLRRYVVRAQTVMNAVDDPKSLPGNLRFTLPGEARTVEVSADDLRAALASARDLRGQGSFEGRRREFLRQLQELIEAKLRLVYAEIPAPVLQALARFLESRDVNAIWPSLVLPDAYLALMADRALLGQIGSGLFAPSELDALAAVPPREGAIEVEDLAPLYCLNELIGSPFAPEYDHIMIDEGQDLSPLQFSVLKSASRNGAFTIVGDVAQSIHASRGLKDWDALHEIFPLESINRQEITRSYRSTQQIIAFANAILKRAHGEAATVAQPFTRPGPRPTMVLVPSTDALMEQIPVWVDRLRNEQLKEVALLTRSVQEARVLAARLSKRTDLELRVILSPNDRVRDKGNVVIAPIRAVKGLEFDAVIVIDASAKTYPGASNIDGRLLYVAATRALHSLTVIARGKFSPLLDEAAKVAERETIKRAATPRTKAPRARRKKPTAA